MSRKILIVDDEYSMLSMLKMIVEMREFTAVTAKNGREALDIVEKEQPDLIMLDLMMPVMDGFQVLEALKQNDATKGIPVVIVSAQKDEKDINRAYNLGAADYVVKGGHPRNYLDMIERHLLCAEQY
ncbi:MAG: response regulator [Elusimicrobiota bacterium]